MKQNFTPRVFNWSVSLAEYKLEIIYKSGRLHMAHDCLSRAAIEPPNEIFDRQVMVVIPSNPKEVQAADK